MSTHCYFTDNIEGVELEQLGKLNAFILRGRIVQDIAKQVDAIIHVGFVPYETGHRVQICISSTCVRVLVDVALSEHVDFEEFEGNLPCSVPLGLDILRSMAIDDFGCIWIIDAVIFRT